MSASGASEPTKPQEQSGVPQVAPKPDARYLGLAFACSATLLHRLRGAVGEFAQPRGRLVRARRDAVVALFEIAPGEDWLGFAEQARRRVAAETGDPRLTVGVGGPRERYGGARVALLQAEQAALFGPVLRGDGRVIAFGELGPSRFVLGQPVQEIRELRDRYLGPLAADRQSERALLLTLETYLRLSANINAVARALSVHRNTVRYRLRRVADILGVDLDDPDARLTIQLAILATHALARIDRPDRALTVVQFKPEA